MNKENNFLIKLSIRNKKFMVSRRSLNTGQVGPEDYYGMQKLVAICKSLEGETLEVNTFFDGAKSCLPDLGNSFGSVLEVGLLDLLKEQLPDFEASDGESKFPDYSADGGS
jgi:hypothetical protein